jgi:hypothetical protein
MLDRRRPSLSGVWPKPVSLSKGTLGLQPVYRSFAGRTLGDARVSMSAISRSWTDGSSLRRKKPMTLLRTEIIL